MHFVVEDYKANIFNGKAAEGLSSTTRNLRNTRKKNSQMRVNVAFYLP